MKPEASGKSGYATRSFGPVAFVPDHGHSRIHKVAAQLVLSTGDETKFQEGKSIEILADGELGLRLEMPLTTCIENWMVDGACIGLWYTGD